ncbi:ABC transporter permease [Roseofilum reptotaenium CS-1145]|uniref:ABC transporter substrate-binding protein n=1 Tax=Roseofilum reptotaenium AO1-A TaxID=1925591 RepID=A0A1L9QWU0_9CYAN|nr:ABC transporter permease [Roseofilum reptotaenium]MDB9518527.1 ABC transporter permease [Roseofilum reptotaenium CS-1145]OJJ27067.1 ABC transporter substrate-binding protein [Roseofilum reptotaenium AO1-A]
MDWWQKLRKNPLAQVGAVILIIFYIVVIGAGFFAPYSPYSSQLDGSLLPPTPIEWLNEQGQFSPRVYPVTQGATDLDTGDRPLIIDRSRPSPLRLFVQGDDYKLLGIIPATLHLFGTQGEGRLNLLGTDRQARDQFSRLLYGGQISLSIGLVGILISFPLGMLVGGISGYFGGWTDAILMRLVEVLMTIPGIYLLVALAAVIPPQLTSAQRFLLIVIITSFISWSGLARVIRGQVLSIKEQQFVQAAKAMGANPVYIIVRHVLPQTATYVIISATLAIPGFIVAESVLSLIGLGIQEPDPSWGNLLSAGTNASILVLQPWLVWPPAILIILTVLSFNLLGDGLRDALDPRSLREFN